MDALGALIALLTPALPDWAVMVPTPAGIVAADTSPEAFPPTVIVEQTGGQDAATSPITQATYRLRFMAPSSVAAVAAWATVRALGRDPTTGIRRGGQAVAGYGYLRSLVTGQPVGPLADPDLGTPTLLTTVTATWNDTGG